MNSNTLEGEGTDFGGKVKETVGNVAGDKSLQGSGLADQLTGKAQKTFGAAADAVANPGPLADKAKQFARDRPWATAALVGTVALAVINTLRGK